LQLRRAVDFPDGSTVPRLDAEPGCPDNIRVERRTKPSYENTPVLRILKLLFFAAGVVTIFWYFFSFIGILIGILLFVASRDPRWRAHGFMLSLSAATSEFAAHTGSAVAPLLLGMQTGPVMLAGYLLLFLLLTWLMRGKRKRSSYRGTGGASITDPLAAWIDSGLKIGGSIWRRARFPLTVILIGIPVGLWASVSIRPGVLIDNRPRMLWVHAPSTVVLGETFPVTVQAWDAY
jgi:hypothetical protein